MIDQDAAFLGIAGFGSNSLNVGSYLGKKRKVPDCQRIRYFSSPILSLGVDKTLILFKFNVIFFQVV